VHADQFDVVVTGTQFNVMNREGRTNVMLTEGSVILKTRQGKDIYMKPGDFVEFNAQEPAIKLAKEEDKVLAWKEKKLYFDHTPLSIAAQDIEELYGVTIRLENQKVREKPLTGIMVNDNLDILLQALEVGTGFHVVRKNNEILITE
jgi:ferric-dicitrate binding protein FerR (iron transport regulator)